MKKENKVKLKHLFANLKRVVKEGEYFWQEILTVHLLRVNLELKYEKCVVQRYMSRPFLIDGLKFDLRVYVLIAGTDPLRIFVYNEGLARFCTEPYETPKSDNLDNKFMHLTNYAINKLSPNFIFNEEATCIFFYYF